MHTNKLKQKKRKKKRQQQLKFTNCKISSVNINEHVCASILQQKFLVENGAKKKKNDVEH